MKRSNFLLLGSSIITAAVASLCCILPIVFAVTGIAGLAAAASFERWRPYFLALTVTLLAGGAFYAYRDRKKGCAPGRACANRPMSRWNTLALALLAFIVIALAAFPYYSGAIAKALVPHQRASVAHSHVPSATATFLIPDMDCPACATGLRAALEKLPGVREATVDYDSRRATIIYEAAKQNSQAFTKVVNDAGYHVTPF